jgi:hypothetical protein
MRKLMGIPFVSLFIVFFLAQWITRNSGVAVGFAVLAGFGLQRQRPLHVFWVNFLAMVVGWAILAWYLDQKNGHVLSERMLDLFPLKTGSLLILASALIGGIWAGTAGLAGLAIGRLFSKTDAHG